MISFIKRHWPVYLILFLLAIALGFGAAYVVGVKGSTPTATLEEQVKSEDSGNSTGSITTQDTGSSSTSE